MPKVVEILLYIAAPLAWGLVVELAFSLLRRRRRRRWEAPDDWTI
jgi:hypothetical protein